MVKSKVTGPIEMVGVILLPSKILPFLLVPFVYLMMNEKTRVTKNVPSIKAIPIIIKLRNSAIISGWRAADLSKPFIKNPSARDTPIQARHRPKKC